MATDSDRKGAPAKLHLACRVKSVDPESATITLEDGSEFHGDLLIGADGVHSRTRASIPGGDKKPFDSGKSAFRFLIPTETLKADPRIAGYITPSTLTMWIGEDRRLVMYPCMDNTQMNFVCIHPSKESEVEGTNEADWQKTGSKERMLQIYDSFHTSCKSIIEKAEQPKIWKLLDMDKMPTFIHKRLAVMGDAAHPFLPHQGQGGGQAIEDAVSLAVVLPLGTLPEEVSERLQIYNRCRYERAHKIQDFTRTAGKDASELAAEGKKLDMHEYQAYNFCHDAWDYTNAALKDHLVSKDKIVRFRSPLSFGPSPGPRRPIGLDPSHSAIQSLQKSNPEAFTTYSVRFQTSRTYLQNMLPPGFDFATPGTKVYASICCTTLDNMAWLGGKGYNHCGLYIHGVSYTKRDGSKLHGTYLPVLFENLTDPIITGRSELGMPKLFAYINVAPGSNESSCNISLSWRGAEFGNIEIASLAEDDSPMVSGTAHAEPQRGPGPPPPPPEQGLFVYRYVPAVGEPGKADAEYPVFVPKADPQPGSAAPQSLKSTKARLQFSACDWQSLPTLHHIARDLAEIPIYGIEEAKLTKGYGVDDVSGARRIE
ncbi:FAD/NAD(P)-binding domain-containing protein [Hortaea werneckii]|nr:FAD/NAD(P)-binding domain-containing protein [Hortaea werneckii]